MMIAMSWLRSVICLVATGVLLVQAQSYRPDTSLTYSEFLQECVQFSKKTNQQEIWVVTFWASWNSSSLSGLSQLKNLSHKYANKPIRFVSISIDKNRDEWLRMLNRYEMGWEQVIVQRENDYIFLKKAFKHNAIPAYFIVTRDAKVNHLHDLMELDVVLSTESASLPSRPYQRSSPPKPMPAGQPRPTGGEQWLLHTVKSGETLFGIARQYGVTVEAIRQANGMPDNTIRMGMNLRIKRK